MRILFAATKYPQPPTNGQAMRTLSLLEGLAELGHELSLVAFAPEAGAAPPPPVSCCHSVDLVPARRMGASVAATSGASGRLACLLTGQSYSINRFRSAPMRAALTRRLQPDACDLVFCDSMYALTNLPPTSRPVVLNCHNVEHLIYARFASLETGVAKRLYARCEGQAVRRAERQACGRASLALTCSDTDRALLKELRPNLSVVVVPNVVDAEALAAAGSAAPDEPSPTLLFQGSMDWYPNRDAVEYFAQEILPLIRTQRPEARFLVAGRNPPPSLVKRLGMTPGIEFTGTVPDMNPYLRRATLAVVPLRLGSGTRLKILEACGAGKAVVSTTLGAEGLGLCDGREILLADQPASFADAVLRLLREPAARGAIAAAGQEAVVRRYSRAALRSSLQTALALLSSALQTAAAEVAWR